MLNGMTLQQSLDNKFNIILPYINSIEKRLIFTPKRNPIVLQMAYKICIIPK